MITINEGSHPLTVINVFTVDGPDKQADVVRILSELTERTVRHHDGFLSTNIHASIDGTRVVNYAQWESQKHLEAMMGDPEAQAQMRVLLQTAKSEPHLYEVAKVYEK